MKEFSPIAVTTDNRITNHLVATNPKKPQGDLLSVQPGMPKFEGYFRTIIMLSNGEYHAWTEIVGRDYGWFGIVGPDQQKAWGDYVLEHAALLPQRYLVPVLHCEFEGSRIRDMLNALDAFSFGGKWCKKNFLFRAFCVVLQTAFAPLALATLAVAWATADDGSPAGALQGGGTINNKDTVIVRGRWVYDGGHGGYNEIHATRTVQKVFNIPSSPAEFEKFRKQWCDRMGEVPHSGAPGVRPQSPAEQSTYDNQQEPENQWTLHPDVDGCVREEEPPSVK